MRKDPDKKPVAYIMVEIGARETLAKLNIAYELLMQGEYNVVIGTQAIIRAITKSLPLPGLSFQNSCNFRFREEYRKLKLAGYTIVSVDEEPLKGIVDPEVYIDERFDPVCVDLVDIVSLASSFDHSIVSKYRRTVSDKSAINGFPAFDFTSRENRPIFHRKRQEIIAKYGTYYLYASSLAGYNIHPINISNNGLDEYFHAFTGSEKVEEFRRQEYSIQGSVYALTIEALEYIAKELEYPVVIRPHPAEDWTRWAKLSSQVENIFVEEPNDNIYPWLLSCRALIHYNCTTAIQHYCLGRKPICLAPKDCRSPRFSLANLVSKKVSDSHELLKELNHSACLLDQPDDTDIDKIVKLCIHDYNSGSSANRLATNVHDRCYERLIRYGNNAIEMIEAAVAKYRFENEDEFTLRCLGDFLSIDSVRNNLELLQKAKGVSFIPSVRSLGEGVYVLD